MVGFLIGWLVSSWWTYARQQRREWEQFVVAEERLERLRELASRPACSRDDVEWDELLALLHGEPEPDEHDCP